MDRPSIGRGDGRSCSKTAKSYETAIGLCLDLPGLDDTELDLDASKVARLGAVELVAQDVDGVRALVFDSLADSTTQLRSTVADLVASYGTQIKDGVIVVATKRDRADSDELPYRIGCIRETMAEIGIGRELVLWQNKKIDAAGFERQLIDLRAAISRTAVVATDDLRDLNEQIAERAQILCKSQTPLKKTEMVEVEEQYVEETKKYEPKNETYWEMETYKEAHKVQIAYQERTGEWKTLGRVVAGIATIGITEMTGAPQGWMETRFKTETEHRDATRQVMKTRVVEEWNTYKDTKVRLVHKPTEVDIRVPVEHFFGEARAAIMREARKEMSAK